MVLESIVLMAAVLPALLLLGRHGLSQVLLFVLIMLALIAKRDFCLP